MNSAFAHPGPASGAARPPGRGTAVLMACLALVALCHAWLTAPQSPSAAMAVPPAPIAMAEPNPPARFDAISRAEDRVVGLLDAFAARLHQRPADAAGWQTLGRSYESLGRYGQALNAFRTASRLRPDDPDGLTEHARCAAVVGARGDGDEAARLLAHALQVDAGHRGALTLATALALDRGDAAAASRYRARLDRLAPAAGPAPARVRELVRQERRVAARRFGVLPGIGRDASWALPWPGGLPTFSPSGVDLGELLQDRPSLRGAPGAP